jgi:Ser/Thr protein kinase RdoA (MazF antagonist)/LysM repeat protein
MNKKIVVFFVFVILISLTTLPTSAAPLSDNEQEALQISKLINEYRQQNGLYEYVYSPVLAATAQKHGDYQASIEESTHYGENDSRSRDRAEAMGYGSGSYIFVSEMIYAGQFATPQKALEWWKNSPIHNGIMLSEEYHEFGVAVARSETRIYYTVNVGAVRGVTSPGVGSGGEILAEPTSAPVATTTPDVRGGIYHIVQEGQTLAGIATAYNVDIDTLRLLTALTENSSLGAGQILLIKQPQVPDNTPTPQGGSSGAGSTTSEPSTSEGEPLETTPPEILSPTQPQSAPGSVVPTQTPVDFGGAPTNWLLIAAVVIVVFGVIGFLAYYYLQTQKQGDDSKDDHKGHDRGDFNHQTRQTQLDILREVAEVALDAYPLTVERIEPLRYVLNAEFLVAARQEGRAKIEQYVVRVNAPRFHSPAEIASELEWLVALNEQTKITVPSPIRKRNGEWVETVTLPFLEEPRHCVVFRYIPGETIELKATPEHLEVVGALVGLLHKHGAQFVPPHTFTRKHWDLEGLTGGMLDVPGQQAYAALNEHEREIVTEAEKLVTKAMAKIGRSNQTYGLIHADLHLKSFLFHQKRPLILDFDTCGYGFYAYDLSVPIWNLFHRDDFEVLRAALLKGYRRVRVLSLEEESMLMHFVAGRLMTQILTWAGRREHTNLSEIADEAITKEVGQLELLIRLLVS